MYGNFSPANADKQIMLMVRGDVVCVWSWSVAILTTKMRVEEGRGEEQSSQGRPSWSRSRWTNENIQTTVSSVPENVLLKRTAESRQTGDKQNWRQREVGSKENRRQRELGISTFFAKRSPSIKNK